MEKTFWLERWEQNLVGFHQPDINPHLKEYWQTLSVKPGTEVLVPLCGKSQDMRWLAEQGCRVLGVELSERAVTDFFRENDYDFDLVSGGAFKVYSNDVITLLCGDFFALQPAQVDQVRAVYDRASLIALPPPMRADFARHLSALLPDAVMLLLTMEYPQEQMSGPPFSVSEREVRELFEPDWSVTLLYSEDILSTESKFRDRGLTRLVEKTYRLERHSP
ncbi:MAG: thiopurine S-methyltransferase [Thiogranum sp.]|nr:thiopurine S-methyltransferase [Thiogranum sp.]